MISEAGIKATIAPTAISTRSIAPAKKLLGAGIPVGLGSDNIRDFFNPLGSGDVKQMALLLSYLQRFYTAEEVTQIFRMITDGGAGVLGIKDYGISAGSPANVCVLDAKTPAEVVACGARPVYLMRGGAVI